MEAKKRKPYKPRTLKGAEVYVRNLRSQLDDLERYLVREQHTSRLLARLAAKGPAFDNLMVALEAEKRRDQILAELGLNPDGTCFRSPRPVPGNAFNRRKVDERPLPNVAIGR